MIHRRSGPYAIPISLHDDGHMVFIHESNCIPLRTYLVRMVRTVEIAYGISWKSRRSRCMRQGEEVELYETKISEMIHMLSIAGRKCRNMTGPHHLSLT